MSDPFCDSSEHENNKPVHADDPNTRAGRSSIHHSNPYLDGKLVLIGGSKEDRQAAHEWISMFLNDAAVRELKPCHYKS
jgi:hypothetical protein